MKRLLNLVVILFASSAFAQAQDSGASALDRAYAEMQAAAAALKAVEAKRDQGEEPQGGERTGTQSGFSRLNENYFSRQQALDQELAAARQRYDDAVKRWNQLK